MEEMNAVLALLSELLATSDNQFVQVGKHTVRLSDPKLPTKRGVNFVKDRLSELSNAAEE